MTAPTLPGDIQGLLRRGSPVVPVRAHAWHTPSNGHPCSAKASSVVRAAPHPGYTSVYLCDWGNTPLDGVALDLSDPTGRVHAAWYYADRLAAMTRGGGPGVPPYPRDVIVAVMESARQGRDMAPEQIDILRRLVLHVAGREVTA